MNPTFWSSQDHKQCKQRARKSGIKKASLTVRERRYGDSTIGILTTNQNLRYLRIYLLTAHKMHSEAFVFRPQDVDWDKETVLGWKLVQHKARDSWVCEELSLPAVVYNRITNRTAEASPAVAALKNKFQQRGIPIFNKSFFNKTQIFDLLSDSAVTDLLPVTQPFDSPGIFQDMCHRFPTLYIKPSGGSLGMGIIRVEQQTDGFRMQFRYANRNQEWNYRTLPALYRHIKKICANKQYIIQQGIQLREIHDSPADFRVHMHKTADGVWECTAIGGKVAGEGSITTHVHSGGRIIDAKELFYLWNVSTGYVRLEANAIRVADELEKRTGQIIGELGMDMGMDTEDRIWLFEVNSKPGRAIFKHPNLHHKAQESAARIIEFSRLLAKMPAEESRRG